MVKSILDFKISHECDQPDEVHHIGNVDFIPEGEEERMQELVDESTKNIENNIQANAAVTELRVVGEEISNENNKDKLLGLIFRAEEAMADLRRLKMIETRSISAESLFLNNGLVGKEVALESILNALWEALKKTLYDSLAPIRKAWETFKKIGNLFVDLFNFFTKMEIKDETLEKIINKYPFEIAGSYLLARSSNPKACVEFRAELIKAGNELGNILSDVYKTVENIKKEYNKISKIKPIGMDMKFVETLRPETIGEVGSDGSGVLKDKTYVPILVAFTPAVFSIYGYNCEIIHGNKHPYFGGVSYRGDENKVMIIEKLKQIYKTGDSLKADLLKTLKHLETIKTAVNRYYDTDALIKNIHESFDAVDERVKNSNDNIKKWAEAARQWVNDWAFLYGSTANAIGQLMVGSANFFNNLAKKIKIEK